MSCSVEMTEKCAAPYSKEYQKGALDRTVPCLFCLPPALASGIVKRLATATPHSPPESFPACFNVQRSGWEETSSR